MEQNSWTYKGSIVTEIPDGYEGFIYQITNTETGKKYIGKKQFKFSKTKTKTITLKNGTKKKKKIKEKIDSDWQDYYGSSDFLKQDIEKLGVDKFTREILYLCKTKAECSYIESYLIFATHSLLREDYYNSWVSARIRKDHIIGKINLEEIVIS